MQPINPLRGESELVIAGNKYVLAATFESFAQLSMALGDPPFQNLYDRLIQGALGAQRAALAVFIQGGTDADGKSLKRQPAINAALRDLSLAELSAWVNALIPLLEAVTRRPGEESTEPGNP